ncbi:TPA: DUF817 family protein [Bacillus toyonensis]|nr:DUF817 family protein [Bacillus toyonensis]
MLDLLYFGYYQALSCIFSIIIFVTLAVSKIISIPGLHRYDFILLICLITQYFMFKTNLEPKNALKLISVFEHKDRRNSMILCSILTCSNFQ